MRADWITRPEAERARYVADGWSVQYRLTVRPVDAATGSRGKAPPYEGVILRRARPLLVPLPPGTDDAYWPERPMPPAGGRLTGEAA